jgi:hypothetical protein
MGPGPLASRVGEAHATPCWRRTFLARDVLRAGPGDFPVGVTLAMQDCVAVPGGEKKAAEAGATSFDPFLEAARDDDFIGVQTYSPERGEYAPFETWLSY